MSKPTITAHRVLYQRFAKARKKEERAKYKKPYNTPKYLNSRCPHCHSSYRPIDPLKLRELRLDFGFTLQQMANIVDRSFGYIAKIEAGDAAATPDIVAAYQMLSAVRLQVRKLHTQTVVKHQARRAAA